MNIVRYINHFVDLDGLNEDSIVVDAGACRGDVIKFLKKHSAIQDANICAIEPCRGNHETFLRDVPYALFKGSLVGANHREPTVRFQEFVGLPGWGNSFAWYEDTKRKDLKEVREYDVQVLRVTDLFTHFGIDRIDYLKLDIVGMEKSVLRTMPVGMMERVRQISMEVYTDKWSLNDVRSALRSWGFGTIVDARTNEVYGVRL